jgi:phosphoribosylglycinamide formyltransferase 2
MAADGGRDAGRDPIDRAGRACLFHGTGAGRLRLLSALNDPVGGSPDAAEEPACMTTLGTPLSPNATRVMLLGAGELGKEVLIALQRLGVETIAVDRYADAPGHQVAHHAVTLPMNDAARLEALIEAERPDLVVPEIEAIATPVLQALEAAGKVGVVPTARAARLTMDREGIRRLAAETLGLPTSPYRFCDSLSELQAAIDGGIGYPCIVKPVMSSSGKGQSRIEGPDDVQRAWDYAMAGGRVNRRSGHRRGPGPTSTSRSRCSPCAAARATADHDALLRPGRPPPGPRRLCRELAAAADDRTRPWPEAQDIARQVTGALGGRGIFGVELFVRGDRGLVQRGQPAPARHRHGHHDDPAPERVRPARARHPWPAGRHAADAVGASAVIYGGIDAVGIGSTASPRRSPCPGRICACSASPRAFTRRRMGVALARADDTDCARANARLVAGRVRPRAAT